MQALLDSGCAAPRLQGPVLLRVLRSWASLDAPPIFDMRYGGLGLVFLAALPVAAVVAWRRRSVAILVLAAATLASPDPAVPRYVFAFPGLVLALAASALGGVRPAPRRALLALAATANALALWRAFPGLAGEGPPLSAYARMTERERLGAVGADGSPAPFYAAHDRVEGAGMTAFDASLDLPYLAWPPDLSRPALRVPDLPTRAEVERIVADERVRLLMVGDASAVAAAARSSRGFVEIFRCKPRVPPKCLDVPAPTEPRFEDPLAKAIYESSSCVVLLRR